VYVIQIGSNESVLYVNYCTGNIEQKLQKFVHKQPHLKSSVLRPDLYHHLRQYKLRREVERVCREFIQDLERRGFEVIAGTPLMQDRWSLYVIQINGDESYLYVGSTNYPIEKRFQQHVYKYHPARIFLHEDIFDLDEGRSRNLPTFRNKQEAEEAEARLAEVYKQRGFKVKGGH
jgi:hypothetical protein